MRKLVCVALVVMACGGAPKPAAVPAKKFAMRTYTFVLLRRGPAWTPEQTPETKQIFAGHMANIEAMHKAGKLVLAGPLDGDQVEPSYAGLFVMDVASDAEARALLAHDPAIASGRFVPELRQWYGPVGLTYDGADQITP